jgi:hypothetical protein
MFIIANTALVHIPFFTELTRAAHLSFMGRATQLVGAGFDVVGIELWYIGSMVT